MSSFVVVLVLALAGCEEKDLPEGDGDGGTGDGGTGGGDGGGDGGDGDGGGDGGGTGDGGTGDGGTGDGGTGDGGGAGGTGGSIWDRVDPTLCDDVDGFEGVAGAASYFVGEYGPAGDPTSGTETWALYANPAWEEDGGADCVVVWTMAATTTGTGACGSCDYGLEVTATLDLAATTCDENLYRGDESWTTTYDVDEGDDGTATWSYATSGTQFGTGYVTAGGLSFITEDSCTWWGR